MIEPTTTPVVKESMAPDPDFRVEPQEQVPFVVPSFIEASRVDNKPVVHWSVKPLQAAAPSEVQRVLDRIVTASKREADRHSHSVRARMNYGVALLNAGRFDAAADEFEVARHLEPANVSALVNLGRVRMLTNRVAEAQSLAMQARHVDPSNVLSALLSAAAAIHEGEYDVASQVLKEARRVEPDNWALEYMLGITLIAMRDVPGSIRHLRSAARARPRSAAVHHALGVSYGLQGYGRKAARSFREALTLEPRRRESVFALARVLLLRGASSEAIAVLSDWASTVSIERECEELLAHAYRLAGDHKATKRHLLRALHSIDADSAHRSDRARVLNNLGVCSGTLMKNEEAAEWYTHSIEAMPSALAYRNLAQVHRELGNLQLADNALAAGLELNPNDPEVRLLSGIVAGQLGRFDEAMETMNRLIASSDACAGAYAALGLILADEKRDFPAALEVLSEGYKRFPSDVSVANNVAYVNLMLGNLEAAGKILAGVSQAEIRESVYLTATTGLYRLLQGNLKDAESLYKAAEALARRQGRRALAKTVRQKMHLEFARSFLRMEAKSKASDHVKHGLGIEGRQSYRADLLELNRKLLES